MISLITPSYAPDFERCRLLCQSIEPFVSGYDRHYLVVDSDDIPLFKSLTSSTTEIICKQDMLPHWLHKIPYQTKWWLSSRSLPVRGWILQQLIKLSTGEHIDSDVYLFVDSDTLFVKPFDVSSIVQGEGVRLYRTSRKPDDYLNKRKNSWHLHAKKLFGLPDHTDLSGEYIAQLVSWRRDTLLELTRFIEDKYCCDWRVKLARTLDFSEYTLYGVYVEHVAGFGAKHILDSQELCHSSWHFSIQTVEDIRRFITDSPASCPAVHLQSNLQFPVESYIDSAIKKQNQIG